MRRVVTVLLCAAMASCRGAAVAPAPATSPAPALAPVAAVPADVHFVSGMIAHHAQAVVLGRWATDSIHGAGTAIRTMSERIVVGQTDEIALFERWLHDRHVAPMDHQMHMPGMLTAAQLAQLNAARGPAFDRLFLTLMIQHHEGAVTMVDQLLAAPGAAQDGLVFRFAADIHADQTTEIERMRRMLAALPPEEQSP